MLFDYIEENIKKIIDPNKVLMIKHYSDEKGKLFLGALVSFKKGKYELIPLTKSRSWWNYPTDPIYDLSQMVGMIYIDDNFAVYDSSIAFNRNHLLGFNYSTYENDSQRICTLAKFRDGSRAICFDDKKNHFDRRTIHKLQDFLINNGIEPKYGGNEDLGDTIIDYHYDGNVATIPSISSNALDEEQFSK